MDDDTGERGTATKTARRLRARSYRPAATLALLASALPMLAHAGCQVETLELPVKMVASRAVATVGINGTQVPLTVDSGAFFSFLTDAAAAQLGLRTKPAPALRVEGVTGRVDARTTKVDKMQLLKGDVAGVDFIVGGNEPGAGTMGLMGRNILSIADTEYDLAHGVIRFLFPNDECAKVNMAYWAGTAPVTELELVPDYRSKLPSIRVRAKLNDSDLTILFDTGATTVVSARATRRAGVAEADWKSAGIVRGAGRGSAQSWTAPFETLRLGGETLRRNRLFVADFDLGEADMLLGIDFFLSHRIYVSKQQSRMFLTYNGGPVFALDTRDRPSAADLSSPTASEDDAVTADQFARRGAASAARRDYESALADLDKACALEPTSANHFAQRGTIQENLKHPAKALDDYDAALALDPTQVDARFRRVSLRLAAKDRDGAKADLDALDRTLAPQAQLRLAMSRSYAVLEQPAQALAQLNQWLPAHPNEVGREAALNSRCWARLMLGIELDQALDDCDDAIDGDAKSSAYRDSRGWVYLRLGRYGKAISDFDRSIELRATNAYSLYGRGLAKTRLGDAAAGDIDLAAARKLQPDIDRRAARIGLVKEPEAKP